MSCNRRVILASACVSILSVGCVASLPGNRVKEQVSGYWRVITSNGLPDHVIDATKYADLPGEQDHTFVMPAYPGTSDENEVTPLPFLELFGVALNGVPLDPHAAAWWNPPGGLRLDWVYDALHPSAPLPGFDDSNAHVQPDHTYHYHGLPMELFDRLSAEAGSLVVQVGWGFDGTPVFGPACESGTPIPLIVQSGYRLVEDRGLDSPPVNAMNPLGVFVRDWMYDPDPGDLDECNGHTAELDGWGEVYHYHLTVDFPMIPRCYRRRLSPIEGPTNLDPLD